MISLKTKEIDKSLNKIDKAADRLKKNKRVLFLKWSILGFKDITKHFKAQSGPKGRWKPLAASTIRARRKGKGKGSARILQDTRELHKSLMPGIGLKDFQRNRLILFTNVPYAKKHDEGKGRIPQREFMWLGRDAKKNIKEQTIKFMRPWR
jgi:phage gpG-like protein